MPIFREYYWQKKLIIIQQIGFTKRKKSMQGSLQHEQIVMQPPLYFTETNAHIWSITFHPTNDILACSLITGEINVLKYDSEDVNVLLKNTNMHKFSARCCQFNPAGNCKDMFQLVLATCGEDKRIGFLDGEGKVKCVIKKAHPTPINRCKFLNDSTLISGDDDGLIKIWDLRTATPVFEADAQSEAITGITFNSQDFNSFVYTSCLDGSVAAYDLRQASDSISKVFCLSDSIDEELFAIEMVKNGKYIVCPSSEGSLIIYRREELEYHVDRIQGLPGSVDAMIKVNENTLISGTEDGYVRGVSIYPNSLLQVLGQHEEQQEEKFPIQSLSLSHCRRFVASCSHDNSIKFYDVNEFVKKRDKVVDLGIEEEHSSCENQMNKINQMWEENRFKNSEDPENSEYEDQSSSSDESMEQKPRKKKKTKKVNLKAHEKQIKKQQSRTFFKGL